MYVYMCGIYMYIHKQVSLQQHQHQQQRRLRSTTTGSQIPVAWQLAVLVAAKAWREQACGAELCPRSYSLSGTKVCHWRKTKGAKQRVGSLKKHPKLHKRVGSLKKNQKWTLRLQKGSILEEKPKVAPRGGVIEEVSRVVGVGWRLPTW